jgi:D-alanyl-D-alanine carboxypeptidase
MITTGPALRDVDDAGERLQRLLDRAVRLNAPGKHPVTLIGHSGASGSWLFECPELDLLVTGTLDEVGAHARPFRLIPRVLHAVVA